MDMQIPPACYSVSQGRQAHLLSGPICRSDQAMLQTVLEAGPVGHSMQRVPCARLLQHMLALLQGYPAHSTGHTLRLGLGLVQIGPCQG